MGSGQKKRPLILYFVLRKIIDMTRTYFLANQSFPLVWRGIKLEWEEGEEYKGDGLMFIFGQ